MGSENKNFRFLFWQEDTWGGGLLNAEDVETQLCAKFSRNSTTFLFSKEKLVKTGNIFMFLEQSYKVLQIEHVFKRIFTHFFDQKLNLRIRTAQKNLLLEGV